MTIKKEVSTQSMGHLSEYIAIARPDHWFKNIFMLPGLVLAYVLSDASVSGAMLLDIVVGIFATCMIASANYTINEWLDAESDSFHPVKKHRPSVAGNITGTLVYIQWFVLTLVGLTLASYIGTLFLVTALSLLIMGLLYNIKPIRTKDRIYMDVLSESVNNPLRFLLGWFIIIGDILPPSSVLIAYWMGGAFLMAVKRYSEYRYIDDPERAGLYRRSFQFYSERTLLLSSFFYALTSAFFFGIFIIKYKIEFIVTVPFIAFLFVWYFSIGMREDAVTQRPEKLYREKRFMAYLGFLGLLIASVFFLELPELQILVDHYVLSSD